MIILTREEVEKMVMKLMTNNQMFKMGVIMDLRKKLNTPLTAVEIEKIEHKIACLYAPKEALK